MLHSAMFEFINSFGQIVYETMGEDFHSDMVKAHTCDFEWC
jgi:hypothetical protein